MTMALAFMLTALVSCVGTLLASHRLLASALTVPRRADVAASCQIPDVALFNHRYNLLTDASVEPLMARNVQRTLNISGHAQVVFYDEGHCRTAMAQLEHTLRIEGLADAYNTTADGRIRSDMCRLGQLWLHGGYYYDNDLYVTRESPARFVHPDACLVTVRATDVVRNPPGFFQAFLAAAPHHPILATALRNHARWPAVLARNDAAEILRVTASHPRPNLGTVFLRDAFVEALGNATVLRLEATGYSLEHALQLFWEQPYALAARTRDFNVSGLCPYCQPYDMCGYVVFDLLSGQHVFKSRVYDSTTNTTCNGTCATPAHACASPPPPRRMVPWQKTSRTTVVRRKGYVALPW